MLVACENTRIVVVIVPGPAVRGNVNGMIDMSPLPLAEKPSDGESIFNAIVTKSIPPAIWKAYISMLNTWNRRVPVKAKNPKITNPNLATLEAIFLLFSGFSPPVSDRNIAAVLIGFMIATIDEMATNAKSNVDKTATYSFNL